jgi:hypothetical protein
MDGLADSKVGISKQSAHSAFRQSANPLAANFKKIVPLHPFMRMWRNW